MTDHRPHNCTHRLRDEGKPAPANGCRGCGKQILIGEDHTSCTQLPDGAAANAESGTAQHVGLDWETTSAPSNMAEFEVNHGTPPRRMTRTQEALLKIAQDKAARNASD